jgi:hypothetical protein
MNEKTFFEPIFEKKIKTRQPDRIRSYIYALGMHLARVDGVIGDESAVDFK